MKFATSARTGEGVVALGFPLLDELGASLKITGGIISSLSGHKNNASNFQFSAPIQPGNSGGPLVNMRIQEVGVAAAILVAEDVSNVGFAISGEIRFPDFVQVLKIKMAFR